MSKQGKDRRKPPSGARRQAGTRTRAEEAGGAGESDYSAVVAALVEGIVFMDADGALRAGFAAMVFRTGRWHLGEDAWPEDWRSAH